MNARLPRTHIRTGTTKGTAKAKAWTRTWGLLILLALAQTSCIVPPFRGPAANEIGKSPPVGPGRGHDDYAPAPKPCACLPIHLPSQSRSESS